MTLHIRPLLLAPALLLAFALGVQADQTDHIAFDVSLKGITAGRLTIDGKMTGNAYAANGLMETTGLAGMLKKIRYAAQTSGSYAKGRFTPAKFQIDSQRGEKTSKQSIIYKGGTPASVSQQPPRAPRATDVNPAKQHNTLDPLTALYAVLRDVDPAEACSLNVTLYDGVRRSQVTLGNPQRNGAKLLCTGEYRRLAGFSQKDIAEKTRFPFTLTYAPAETGRLRVVEISTDTILGKGRLIRR